VHVAERKERVVAVQQMCGRRSLSEERNVRAMPRCASDRV